MFNITLHSICSFHVVMVKIENVLQHNSLKLHINKIIYTELQCCLVCLLLTLRNVCIGYSNYSTNDALFMSYNKLMGSRSALTMLYYVYCVRGHYL